VRHDDDELKYLGANLGAGGGGLGGQLLGGGLGAVGGALAGSLGKVKDPKRMAAGSLLGLFAGRQLGDAAGGAAGAGAFGPDGEGADLAKGYAGGSLLGTAGTLAGGGALAAVLKKTNPKMLAQLLGASPGQRLKNIALTAAPFGAMIGGGLGLSRAQED
jgi:hypothetical protein